MYPHMSFRERADLDIEFTKFHVISNLVGAIIVNQCKPCMKVVCDHNLFSGNDFYSTWFLLDGETRLPTQSVSCVANAWIKSGITDLAVAYFDPDIIDMVCMLCLRDFNVLFDWIHIAMHHEHVFAHLLRYYQTNIDPSWDTSKVCQLWISNLKHNGFAHDYESTRLGPRLFEKRNTSKYFAFCKPHISDEDYEQSLTSIINHCIMLKQEDHQFVSHYDEIINRCDELKCLN
jgi:hypothetical protein